MKITPGLQPVGDPVTPRTRGSTWMMTRERILDRDGRMCQCDECKASGEPLTANEVDHVVPLRDGGADDDGNLQALSDVCHKRKTQREADKRAAAGMSTPATATNPLAFLIGVMNDPDQDPRLRVRAAVAAAQYLHTKTHDGGKKDSKNDAAKTASVGKFSAGQTPKLVSSR